MNGQEFLVLYGRNRYRVGQLEKLLETCGKLNASPSEMIIVDNVDRFWPTRRNRTENEKTAVKIGQSNTTQKGYPIYILWAYRG